MSTKNTDGKHEPRSPDPVGYCIYCGADGREVALSDEHILPLALGGDVILPESSCEACAAITSKFEGSMARKVFGVPRVQLDMPTRRPKKRPTTFTMRRKEGATIAEFPVPAGDFPMACGMPIIPGPCILTGQPSQKVFTNLESYVCIHYQDGKPLESFGAGAHTQFTIDIGSTARLMAKIALGTAVAGLGYAKIQSLVGGLIRGIDDRVDYFVGATRPTNMMHSPSGEGKWLHQASIYAERHNGVEYVTAKVRLFANFGMPTYKVVVGILQP